MSQERYVYYPMGTTTHTPASAQMGNRMGNLTDATPAKPAYSKARKQKEENE
jgi:hypothetical protein